MPSRHNGEPTHLFIQLRLCTVLISVRLRKHNSEATNWFLRPYAHISDVKLHRLYSDKQSQKYILPGLPGALLLLWTCIKLCWRGTQAYADRRSCPLCSAGGDDAMPSQKHHGSDTKQLILYLHQSVTCSHFSLQGPGMLFNNRNTSAEFLCGKGQWLQSGLGGPGWILGIHFL